MLNYWKVALTGNGFVSFFFFQKIIIPLKLQGYYISDTENFQHWLENQVCMIFNMT